MRCCCCLIHGLDLTRRWIGVIDMPQNIALLPTFQAKKVLGIRYRYHSHSLSIFFFFFVVVFRFGSPPIDRYSVTIYDVLRIAARKIANGYYGIGFECDTILLRQRDTTD